MKSRAKKASAAKLPNTHRDVITLEGVQTLGTAAGLRSTILQAIADRRTLTIDAGTADTVDIGTLQVLIAAQKSAAAQGQSLSILADANSPVVKMMRATGFLDSTGKALVPEIKTWTISGSSPQ